jgi:NAD(P)-dependent dehydrogenase (short-subunit alcohol dehydrogenase family)
MFRLDGKVALVTGGGSGIGEDIVRAFVEQGAKVVIADIDAEAGNRVANELGASVRYVSMDVTDSASVQAAVQSAVTIEGRLDILVNNAGVGFVGNVQETPEADFDRLHKINVYGVYHGCKHAVDAMLPQGGGCIINIGSVAGLVAVERRFAYCSTKGAVIAMTKELAIDYAMQGIRCNAIAPGTVYTPFVDAYLNKFHAHELEETKAKLHARQPVGRMARPDEIAKMAVYLASDEAEFVTGAVMTIDGGLTAR